MKKYIVAALFFVALTGPAGATDCVPPTFTHAILPTEGEEFRQVFIGMTEYTLCIHQKDVNADFRVKFPGYTEMNTSYVNRLKAELKFWKGRKSVPNAEQYREAYKENKVGNIVTAFGLSLNIGDALYSEKSRRIPDPYLEAMRAEGKNPEADAARISMNTRFPLPTPWFLIGNLTIKRGTTDLTGLNLKLALEVTIERYGTLLTELSQARDVLNESIRQRNGKMKPLETEQRKRQNARSSILAEHQINPTLVRTSSAHKNLTSQFLKAENRMLQLDQAITHLLAERADSVAGLQRIQSLQDEREAEDSKAQGARREREMLFSPDLPKNAAEKVKGISRKVDAAQQDMDRRNSSYGARIDEAEAKVHRAIQALDKAAAERGVAREALGKYLDNLRLMQVTGVKTKHATFVEATEDELKRFQKHLDAMRLELRKRQAEVRDLNVKRGDARVKMLLAGDNAHDANIALKNLGFVSILAQASLELAFAGYDLAESIKLGPWGVFVEGTKQMVMGSAFPPSYYDATSHTLSEYALRDSAPRAAEVVDLDERTSLAQVAKSLQKRVSTTPFKVILKSLDESAGKAAVEAARDSYMWTAIGTSKETQAELLKAAWNHESRLAEVTEEIATMTGKSGKKAFALHNAKKISSDLVKSIAKEAVKKGIAEVVEGGALEDYMLAQLELAQAVARFKHAGNLYWANQDALLILGGMLDGLELRRAEISLLVDEKNEAFYVETDYRVELDIVGQEDTEVAKLRGTLTLGGVLLERDNRGTTLAWKVPWNAVEKFDHSQPESLPLVLTIE